MPAESEIAIIQHQTRAAPSRRIRRYRFSCRNGRQHGYRGDHLHTVRARSRYTAEFKFILKAGR